ALLQHLRHWVEGTRPGRPGRHRSECSRTARRRHLQIATGRPLAHPVGAPPEGVLPHRSYRLAVEERAEPVGDPGQPALSASATTGTNAWNAWPRWLRASFSSGDSSAEVSSRPSGTNTGS